MTRRHNLQTNSYTICLGNRPNQAMSCSSSYASLLKKTFHLGEKNHMELKIHAFFEPLTSDGIRAKAWLDNNGKNRSFYIPAFDIYSVNTTTWAETFVVSKTATLSSDNSFVAHVTQADLGASEMTGNEVYLIRVNGTRVREKVGAKAYFNHLGIYDSLYRLKQDIDFLNITKLDE
jgi:hypothetical protein